MLQLIVFFIIIIISAGSAVVMSRLLGKATHNRQKDMPFESGMTPTGDARIRMAVPYYLPAIFFILFDVELVFLYPWATVAYELSWAGFAKAFVFITFVFAGLVYIWLRGGLIWRHLSKAASAKTSSSVN